MNAPTYDALLVRLGARFDSAAAEEQEAWDKANEETGEGPWTLAAYKLAEVTSEVVEIIERIPATTHEGIMLKIRVYNWCRCWKVVAVKDFEPSVNQQPRRGSWSEC